MPTYSIKCVECGRIYEKDIDRKDLSDEQLEDISEKGKACLTKEQLKGIGQEISKSDEEILESEGCIEVDGIDVGTCSQCGSSETYDSEGNNITSL